jgi:hypothetical protein
MRRYWLPISILVFCILAGLFLGGFLTGQINRELQNPYSRLLRVQGTRFGRAIDATYPNAMTAYYEQTIRGSKPKDIWVPSESSFALPPGFSKPDFINHGPDVPPVTWLDTDTEVTFLRSLRNNKLRLAVIQSLFERKNIQTDKTAAAWNRAEQEQEKERVRRIYRWYELDRKNYGRSFGDWWRDNAAVFGVTEQGDPLPSKTAQK